MILTLFLTKLLGLYLVFLGVALIMHRHDTVEIVNEFVKSKLFVFFDGAMALLIGLAIVLSHNIWAWDVRGVITALGWLIVAKGLLRLFFPDVVRRVAKSVVKGHWYFKTLILFIGLGAWLTYVGFVRGI